MSLRNILATAAVVVVLSSGLAVAQQTLKQQIIGTWSFVTTEATQPDKTKLFPFGPTPKGINIFTADGHFVQIQIAEGIAKFASNSRVSGTAEENKAVVQGSLALFGTYTVDEAARMIIYKVESSTYPNWVGVEQKRPIDSVTADELRHSNLAGSIAGATTVNIWKRTK